VNDDPYETNNLAADPVHAKVKQRLQTELKRRMDELGDSGAAMDSPAVYKTNKK
jgi:hypothetical protein